MILNDKPNCQVSRILMNPHCFLNHNLQIISNFEAIAAPSITCLQKHQNRCRISASIMCLQKHQNRCRISLPYLHVTSLPNQCLIRCSIRHKIFTNYANVFPWGRPILSDSSENEPFSNPTFFDLSENWHSKSFEQKIEVHLLFRPKNLPQKNYRVTNFSILHDFSIILSLITQRVADSTSCFYCRNLCLGAMERYFVEQNLKNKKNQQLQFFSNFFQVFFDFDDLKRNYSKYSFF
jgi:hypothetical protein